MTAAEKHAAARGWADVHDVALVRMRETPHGSGFVYQLGPSEYFKPWGDDYPESWLRMARPYLDPTRCAPCPCEDCAEAPR